MAGQKFVVSTEGEVALAAATLKSVLHVTAPTNIPVKIAGYSIFFDGISPTGEPVRVQLQRVSADGTFTAVTPKKEDAGRDETIQSTAGKNATAEPVTPGDIMRADEVHPQLGKEVYFPFEREIMVSGGARIAIRATAPGAVNCEANLFCEE